MEFPYTQLLEDKSFQIAGEWDETEDYSLAISFLNSKQSFRSFGESLLSIMQKKYPCENVNETTVVPILIKLCGDAGIDITEIASPNTLTNWFKKRVRPKKGEASRKTMFALAFALQLNLSETKNLCCRSTLI